MTITDETLCAFLDGELAPEEMANLRERIAVDETLADRLDALAMADNKLQTAMSTIDETPIPDSILQLANQLDKRDKVVSLTLWKRAHKNLQNYAIAAATVTAVVGFIMGHSLQNDVNQAVPDWQAIANSLEKQPGGEANQISASTTVTSNLTFFNQQGEYCRQFSVNTVDARNSQNVACRSKGKWRLDASIPASGSATSQGNYQVASGPGPIDAILDNMMKGQVLNAEQEQSAIDNAWSD